MKFYSKYNNFHCEIHQRISSAKGRPFRTREGDELTVACTTEKRVLFRRIRKIRPVPLKPVCEQGQFKDILNDTIAHITTLQRLI